MKTHQESEQIRRSNCAIGPFKRIVIVAAALAGSACLTATPVQAQYDDPYYASGPSAAYGYDRGYRPGYRRFWRNRYGRSQYSYTRRNILRARRAAARRAYRAELRRAARRAEKRRNVLRRKTLGKPSLAARLVKPRIVKIRRSARVYVAPTVAPGPLGRFLYDRTLRRGDVVTTPKGLMVFTGIGGAAKHSVRDFRPLRRASRFTGKKLAGQLRFIARANRRAQSDPVLRQVGKSYRKTASTAELPSG